MDPIQTFIDHQGVMVLDGGLATALEARGEDLNDPLWSARVLLEAPEQVVAVHRSFLDAGADCIATATYQASVDGLAARGLDPEAVLDCFRSGVELACRARDQFWAEGDRPDSTRLRPVVAASVGPYGAYLADGSEYRGDYGVDRQALQAFHAPRWEALVATDADLLACEMIPSGLETEVLLELLERTPDARAWFSFSCRDGETLADGTPLVDVARACDRVPGVVGVGANCIPPGWVVEVLETLVRVTSKPAVVYPNTGERYDSATKSWHGPPSGFRARWLTQAPDWVQRGAGAVGGCCRTTPADVRALRSLIVPSAQ